MHLEEKKKRINNNNQMQKNENCKLEITKIEVWKSLI